MPYPVVRQTPSSQLRAPATGRDAAVCAARRTAPAAMAAGCGAVTTMVAAAAATAVQTAAAAVFDAGILLMPADVTEYPRLPASRQRPVFSAVSLYRTADLAPSTSYWRVTGCPSSG